MNKTYSETYIVTVSKSQETNHPKMEVWRDENGITNNRNGPAVITYDPASGAILEKCWVLNGEVSRPEDEGPAIIRYAPDSGRKISEQFYSNGVPHRLAGPAIIERDVQTGSTTRTEHYHNGELVPAGSSEENHFEP